MNSLPPIEMLGSLLVDTFSRFLSLCGRSLPEIPELRIPEAPVVRIASALRIEINHGFAVLRDIASGRDLRKFLAVCTFLPHFNTPFV